MLLNRANADNGMGGGSRYGESSIAERNTIQAAIDIHEELRSGAIAYVDRINKIDKPKEMLIN